MFDKFTHNENFVKKSYDTDIVICRNGYTRIKKYKKPVITVEKGFEKVNKKKKNVFINDEINLTDREFFIMFEHGIESLENALTFEETGKLKLENTKKESRERKDNIARSRNNVLELVAENSEEFKSFITLTFKENITDQKEASKIFHSWAVYMKQKNKNLKYVGVMERQKRGAIHFHLLTSLECGKDIEKKEKLKLWNRLERKYRVFEYYDLIGWNHGYSTAYDLTKTDENFKPELYITKYMTKELSEGGFKILRTNNLKKPEHKKITDNGIVNIIEHEVVFKDYDVSYKEVVSRSEHGVSFGSTTFDIKPCNYKALSDIVHVWDDPAAVEDEIKKNRITYNTRIEEGEKNESEL